MKTPDLPSEKPITKNKTLSIDGSSLRIELAARSLDWKEGEFDACGEHGALEVHLVQFKH